MTFIKSFVLALVVASVALAGDSAVIDLIPKNFDSFTMKGQPALVEFFAPWCGHCKNLAPVYEELAKDFAFAKDKLTIAKVDADSERELGKRFGIQGFPTIKFFDGKSEIPEDYNGGRDLDSLSSFISQKTGIKLKKAKSTPSQVEILTDKTFRAIVGGEKNILVAFTAPWCGHCKSLAPTWELLAHDFAMEPNVVIGKIDAESEKSKATAKEQGVSSYPTIKFFPRGSSEAEDYTSGRNERDLVEFVNTKAGTYRVPGGGLNAIAGTIEAMDKLVEKYMSGVGIKEIASEVATKAIELKGDAQYKYAEYYVKIFDKIGKGDTYAAKELSRLDSIMKKGGLAPEKLDEFTSKTNILKRFVQDVVEHGEL